MKKIFLVILFALIIGVLFSVGLAKAETKKPTIRVISPNGGEIWLPGSVQKIRWVSINIPASHLIKSISLRDMSNGSEKPLLWNVQNDGSENIALSTTLNGSYKLIIKTSVNGLTVSDLSDNYFTIGCGGSLIFDAESRLCMEQPVFNIFKNLIWNNINTCENCTNLPQPNISIDGGTQQGFLDVYLNNKKLLDWLNPAFGSGVVINNPEDVYNPSTFRFNGTNSLIYSLNSPLFFQNRNEVINPNRTTSIRYKLIRHIGQYGTGYFFVLDSTSLNLQGLMNQFDSVAERESNLAGLMRPNPYYIIVWPYMIAGVIGGEGNFHFGNHVISASYGGESYYDQFPDILKKEMSHEYIHDLQEVMRTRYVAQFFNEGMADAVSVFLGYKNWADMGFGSPIKPGCQDDYPHYLGRCLFKHLDQDGYFTESFFQRLFNPVPPDTVNYPGLESCTKKFTEPDCERDLTRLLNFLTGQDMSSFVREKLQAPNNPSVTVISPNGHEVFNTNSRIPISFSVRNIPIGSRYLLSIYDVNNIGWDLGGGVTTSDNINKTEVNPPQGIPPEWYKLDVVVTSPEGMAPSDRSDYWFIVEQSCGCADIDKNGLVSPTDVIFVVNRIGECVGSPKFDSRADMNSDGCIKAEDAECAKKQLGQRINCSMAVNQEKNNLLASILESVKTIIQQIQGLIVR